MKIFQILTEAYGDETFSRAHVFEWYQTFSGGMYSVEDDEPTGNSRSAITDRNIAKVRDMSRFLVTLVVKLLINVTPLEY
ncbi:hypothetical protein TNCV_4906701 [Trichonephila clavipes]|uniref:Mos1 transposase HTH domain-containing protein n=1 Tax=Trichonephila clavipes TaxID=2585209 RepID=A0A8X6RPM4_TRICX|nr:hypothetical protein TNCV_4906701 [Trichonephila clavipes]